jgi:hypothetical protein
MEIAPTDSEVIEIETTRIDPSQVKGWGMDVDSQNDPTYPMRMRGTQGEHAGYSWERPPQQPETVEVLHSNERPNITATFGTSTPPAGLSGMIRRRAFDYSENSYAHWVPLMLADRIGVVEGVVSDLARGHVPNIFGELGWKAEWKHNRTGLLLKIAAGAVVTAAVISVVRGRRNDSADED